MHFKSNFIFVFYIVFSIFQSHAFAQEDLDKNSETVSIETSDTEATSDLKTETPKTEGALDPKTETLRSDNPKKEQPQAPETNSAPVQKTEVPGKTDSKSGKSSRKTKKSWSVSGSCNNCVRVYTGATYLFFSQKPPANLKEVEYKNFTAPSILLEGFYRVYPGWRARFEYVSHSPAEIQADNTFLNKAAPWSYVAIGADWNAIKPFMMFKYGWVPKVYATYQMHSLPYIKQVGANYTLSNEKVDTFSFGFHFDIGKPRSKTSYFFSQRLQTPVNSGGDLKWGTGFGYEGAIGMSKKFADNWSWNVFLGGQYHSYQYADGASSGEYRIGNSMLSVGIGYLN